MKKDFKKIAAQRKAAAERSDSIRVKIEAAFAQMCETQPGSPEEAVLAEKLANLTFMGREK